MRATIQAMRWTAALCAGVLLAGAGAAAAQTNGEARLLVLLRDASALAVVAPAAGTVPGQVPTVSNPHEVTASADGKLAFVASPSGGISVIGLEALTELRRLDVGRGSEPHDVRRLTSWWRATRRSAATIPRPTRSTGCSGSAGTAPT